MCGTVLVGGSGAQDGRKLGDLDRAVILLSELLDETQVPISPAAVDEKPILSISYKATIESFS